MAAEARQVQGLGGKLAGLACGVGGEGCVGAGGWGRNACAAGLSVRKGVAVTEAMSLSDGMGRGAVSAVGSTGSAGGRAAAGEEGVGVVDAAESVREGWDTESSGAVAGESGASTSAGVLTMREGSVSEGGAPEEVSVSGAGSSACQAGLTPGTLFVGWVVTGISGAPLGVAGAGLRAGSDSKAVAAATGGTWVPTRAGGERVAAGGWLLLLLGVTAAWCGDVVATVLRREVASENLRWAPALGSGVGGGARTSFLGLPLLLPTRRYVNCGVRVLVGATALRSSGAWAALFAGSGWLVRCCDG